MIRSYFSCKSYLAELMLICDDLTTFVGTLSLLNAENEATSGNANTMMLTMLFILPFPR